MIQSPPTHQPTHSWAGLLTQSKGRQIGVSVPVYNLDTVLSISK